MTIKKWLTLGAVGTALLLIPRRSSRQTMPETMLSNTPETVSDNISENQSETLPKQPPSASKQIENDNQTKPKR